MILGMMIYPVKEWKQYNFQLVPDILIIHMEIILRVGEVSIDLQENRTYNNLKRKQERKYQRIRFLGGSLRCFA